MAVNKVILVGNVGKDPETRYLDENTPVSKFPLATSEVYRNRDGEKVEQTEWHNIVLWRGLAKVAEQYVKKGTQLYIEGRIRSRSYDDRDGVKRYITEIVGDNMQMLSRKQDDGQVDGGGQQYGGGAQGTGGQTGNQQAAQQAGDQQSGVTQPSGNNQQTPGTPPGSSSSATDPHDAGSNAASDNDPDISGPENESDDLPF